MPDLHDPSQPPHKHRVIHWNPETEEGQAKSASALKAYLGGAAAVLVVLAIGAGAKIFFFTPPSKAEPNGLRDDTSQMADYRKTFTSVAQAEFVEESVQRKLETARQMPTSGHTALQAQLINIEKENMEAENLMKRQSFTKAVEQYNRVEGLIDDFTAQVEHKQQARELYDNFLLRTEEVERGRQLNESAFEKAFIAASEGKRFLDMGSFTPAYKRLTEATQLLDQVEQSIKDYINSNAAQGHRYIAQGDAEQAVTAFTNILNIEPSNEEAVKHLERARKADKVHRLITTARSQEAAGDLARALASYRQALAMDTASTRAQSGVSRTRSMIDEQNFNFQMGQADAALSEMRYEDAIAHFEAALKVDPTRVDLLERIENTREDKHQNDILSRITKAYEHERSFQWQEARDLYQELVQIEPDLKEAKEGLLRSGRMIRSILRYEKLLEVAKSEAQSAEFQQAIRTFDEAMRNKPSYLTLSEEADRLRKFLQLQSQPVPVLFYSDESTWVSIQGPTQRKPERLKELTVNLLPGKYWIFGRKKGFQEVRYALQIRAGMPQEPISVICSERAGF